MKLRIQHRTASASTVPVTFGQRRIMVRPGEGHDLPIESSALEIHPAPATRRMRGVRVVRLDVTPHPAPPEPPVPFLDLSPAPASPARPQPVQQAQQEAQSASPVVPVMEMVIQPAPAA
jgi:hypothetical protein